MLLTQPANLQKLAGKPLSPDERDISRAEVTRKKLNADK
jgi:protein-arginine kinase